MGLLRPATPLSLIFFAAFVLLLLSTLSTPIIHSIPLATYQGWNFGVFGYCKGSKCSGYKIGYSTDGLFTNNDAGNFQLPPHTRQSLSVILIVHPIAAFMALVCFALAAASHFHGPSHSPRYLLALLIFTIPTLLVTLLAFLVDILLFVPHTQWGGWIVLAATILIVASGVVTCAMRRTLVSRKARKKRIAENADMNGANYYENLNRNRLMADELPKADSPPPMNGDLAADKNMPQFATFEMKRHDTRSQDGHDGTTVVGTGSMDDRTPLNPARDPSIRSASSNGRRPYGSPNDEVPPMPMSRSSMDSNGNPRPRRPSRDQYGNPIPAGAMGMAAGELPPPGLRHQDSQGSFGSDRSNGYPPRGRGPYGPPGRGYGPPRGGHGPLRGGYGPRGGFRGQPPPPGWRGGRGGYGPPPGMMGRGGGMPRGGPPPGYIGPIDPYYSNSPRNGPSPIMGQPPTSQPGGDVFVVGPIGQAIEMDHRTGTPPAQFDHGGVSPNYGLRDSDGDVAGMVNLQQGRSSPMRRDSEPESVVRSPTSIYSDQAYVPPRSQWAQQPSGLNPHRVEMVSPVQHDSTSSGHPTSGQQPSGALPLSPIQGSPRSPQGHQRGGSEQYYEDVDPRFAVDPGSEVGATDNQGSMLPTALTPGGYTAYNGGGNNRMASPNHHQLPSPSPPLPPPPPAAAAAAAHLLQAPSSTHIPSYVSGTSIAEEGVAGVVGGIGTDNSNSDPSVLEHPHAPPPDAAVGPPMLNDERDHSYETLPEGARSPGEGSEASHFTSVSQRGINPNWRPGVGSAYGGGSVAPSSASAVQRRKEDVILNANPDFSLPGMGMGMGMGVRGRGRGRGGLMRGYPPPTATTMGLTPSGRYPTDI